MLPPILSVEQALRVLFLAIENHQATSAPSVFQIISIAAVESIESTQSAMESTTAALLLILKLPFTFSTLTPATP